MLIFISAVSLPDITSALVTPFYIIQEILQTLGFPVLIDLHLLVPPSNYRLELNALTSCMALSSPLTTLSVSFLSWVMSPIKPKKSVKSRMGHCFVNNKLSSKYNLSLLLSPLFLRNKQLHQLSASPVILHGFPWWLLPLTGGVLGHLYTVDMH